MRDGRSTERSERRLCHPSLLSGVDLENIKSGPNFIVFSVPLESGTNYSP